jgi:deoxyribodipyrimidine photo-lyase
MHSNLSLVWLRRDLRLHDNAALATALKTSNPIQPIFIFDTNILARFTSKHDRRLSFIAHRLIEVHEALVKRGSGLLVLHGKSQKIILALAYACHAEHLIAAEDYEPETRKRDGEVTKALGQSANMQFVKDQLIFAPTEILREGEHPYKVFTPYAKNWKANLTPLSAAPYIIHDKGRYADFDVVTKLAKEHDLPVIDASIGAKALLEKIGYQETTDELWPIKNTKNRLKDFIAHKASHYPKERDMVAHEGTSKLSPYLRFGFISIRECVQAAFDAKADKWLAELIWREFYAMILYHFPKSATKEWNPKYRSISWSYNKSHFKAWQEGKTGYPLVDAAMRQLLSEGWMHNRARMVVASFLTKHLRIDWRLGEEHFAQILMDYEMASNVGGWQWAASTGTDAQPYFRVFNPTLQSEKFDPDGEYIRRYVPELANVDSKLIHAPWQHPMLVPYYPPIVDHATARLQAIEMFKTAS